MIKTDYAPQWDKTKPNHRGQTGQTGQTGQSQNDRLIVCSILVGFWGLFCLYLFTALTN